MKKGTKTKAKQAEPAPPPAATGLHLKGEPLTDPAFSDDFADENIDETTFRTRLADLLDWAKRFESDRMLAQASADAARSCAEDFSTRFNKMRIIGAARGFDLSDFNEYKLW